MTTVSRSSQKTLWSPKNDPHQPLIEEKGQRYKDYRAQWAETLKLEKVTEMPTQLDFELNPSCNLKCPMCTWSAVKSFGKGSESWMSFEFYKKILLISSVL